MSHKYILLQLKQKVALIRKIVERVDNPIPVATEAWGVRAKSLHLNRGLNKC